MRTQARREQAHRRRPSPGRWPLVVLPALGLVTVVAAASMGSARNDDALGPGLLGLHSPGVAAPSSGLQPGVTDVTIRSAALARDMPAQVFVPRQPAPTDGYPVLYLFHGRYGTERGWMGGSFGREGVGVHDIAQGLMDEGRVPALIIVSALIDDSYGVDSPPSDEGYDHGQYERYIMDELLPDIEARLPISADPADRAIGGLSMGGFAALHAAFRYPDRFGGVAGLSPAVFEGMLPDRQWLYPTAAARQEHDPMLLAETAEIDHMNVFMGVGGDDYPWIIAATDVLADRLSARGVDVTAEDIRGAHDTPTWQRLAPRMLLALFAEA